jgi:hypothetical protein
VISVRDSADFSVKEEFVSECRSLGNDLYRDGNIQGAIVEYERGLSIWNWIESQLSDWKKHVTNLMIL